MFSRNSRLIIAPQAQQDIISILRYTGETWGQNQLLVYRDKLDEAIKTIGQNQVSATAVLNSPPSIACIPSVLILWSIGCKAI